MSPLGPNPTVPNTYGLVLPVVRGPIRAHLFGSYIHSWAGVPPGCGGGSGGVVEPAVSGDDASGDSSSTYSDDAKLAIEDVPDGVSEGGATPHASDIEVDGLVGPGPVIEPYGPAPEPEPPMEPELAELAPLPDPRFGRTPEWALGVDRAGITKMSLVRWGHFKKGSPVSFTAHKSRQ